MRSRVERPHIFAQVALWCWSVLAFSFRIALSRGAFSHFRTESRSGVERPHIFTWRSRVERPRVFAQKRALVWSVLACSYRVALSPGEFSHFRTESACKAKRSAGPLHSEKTNAPGLCMRPVSTTQRKRAPIVGHCHANRRTLYARVQVRADAPHQSAILGENPRTLHTRAQF